MEGHNLHKWGMLLESASMERTFYNKVRIWLKYDLDQFQAGTLQVEDHLTIYSIDQNVFSEIRILLIKALGILSLDFMNQFGT